MDSRSLVRSGGGLRRVAALLAALWLSCPFQWCAAAALAPEVQKAVREGTFEVVVKKPTKDSVTYEKPLPLELLPFSERTDAYWSVGTAFALTPNTFATAAHVIFFAGVGSQFGVPGIRDSQGKVYPIDRVLKFAQHEDYVVFTVTGAPAVTALPTGDPPPIDEPVYAVGNALGEGVVIRDGLLTSVTPEPQDGKWKFLRFSAAASPGNSGGPLLDVQGHVIGIVTMKSPNENLNYALPIAEVLKGPDKEAVFDVRESITVPHVLQGSVVGQLKSTFPLPLSFPEFDKQVRAVFLRYYADAQSKLLATNPDMFPHDASKLLAILYDSREPALVTQDEDHTWDAHSCSKTVTASLPEDGSIWLCRDLESATLFRLRFGGSTFDDRHYKDSKLFMDTLLKGINLPRMVGPQAVRVTSLGPAVEEASPRDKYGRIWQQRTYSLGYSDAYMLVLSLPTPDGYVGLAAAAPSSLLGPTVERLSLLAGFFYMTYTGSLPQWHAFLERRDLRPSAFEHVRLQYEIGKGVRFDSPRLQLDTTGVVTAGPQSALDLRMTYLTDKDGVDWDIGGVVVKQERDRNTWYAVLRQPKPADDAGSDSRERWQHMTKRDGDFSGFPGHDDQYANFWVRTVAAGNKGGDAAQQPLYEVQYNTDKSILPRELDDIRANLTKNLKITE
jgi:serine protease Do